MAARLAKLCTSLLCRIQKEANIESRTINTSRGQRGRCGPAVGEDAARREGRNRAAGSGLAERARSRRRRTAFLAATAKRFAPSIVRRCASQVDGRETLRHSHQEHLQQKHGRHQDVELPARYGPANAEPPRLRESERPYVDVAHACRHACAHDSRPPAKDGVDSWVDRRLRAECAHPRERPTSPHRLRSIRKARRRAFNGMECPGDSPGPRGRCAARGKDRSSYAGRVQVGTASIHIARLRDQESPTGSLPARGSATHGLESARCRMSESMPKKGSHGTRRGMLADRKKETGSPGRRPRDDGS